MEELYKLLESLEWAAHGRYGRQCPSCYGSMEEDWGYVEAGHEDNCELVRLLEKYKSLFEAHKK